MESGYKDTKSSAISQGCSPFRMESGYIDLSRKAQSLLPSLRGCGGLSNKVCKVCKVCTVCKVCKVCKMSKLCMMSNVLGVEVPPFRQSLSRLGAGVLRRLWVQACWGGCEGRAVWRDHGFGHLKKIMGWAFERRSRPGFLRELS